MNCPTHPNEDLNELGPCRACVLGWPPDAPAKTCDEKEAEARANAWVSFPAKVEQVIADYRSLRASFIATPTPELKAQVGAILDEMDRVGQALSLIARAEALQLVRHIKATA